VSGDERDRRDLADVAGALFSNRRRAVPQPPVSRPAEGLRTTPEIDLTVVVSCGGSPGIAAALGLSIAALPTPHARSILLPANGFRETLPRVDERMLADLERTGGRLIVELPPRDGPAFRAVALAAARHIVWIDRGPDGAQNAASFFAALDYACEMANVGWLSPADEGDGPESIARWVSGSNSRRATALGRWNPGLPFPAAVSGFLAQRGPGSAAWAWARTLARLP
jgi:hypothetical protein